MEDFDRRGFIKAAGVLVAAGAAMPVASAFAGVTYNAAVDEKLFGVVNMAKDQDKLTPLEMSHAPEIKAPDAVKAGEPFMVEVSVGRKLHPTTAAHRIYYIELMAGNEPIGMVTFESTLAQPKASFLVSLEKSVTLVAQSRCNLHGLWESALDIKVS